MEGGAHGPPPRRSGARGEARPHPRRPRRRAAPGRLVDLRDASLFWLDLPEHGVRVVHAGVLPGVPIDRTKPSTLMRIRTVRSDGGSRARGPGAILLGLSLRGAAARRLRAQRGAGAPAPPVGDGARHRVRLRRPAHGARPRRERQRIPMPFAPRRALLVSQPAARVYFRARPLPAGRPASHDRQGRPQPPPKRGAVRAGGQRLGARGAGAVRGARHGTGEERARGEHARAGGGVGERVPAPAAPARRDAGAGVARRGGARGADGRRPCAPALSLARGDLPPQRRLLRQRAVR